MQSKKGTHRIIVAEVEYRWKATGDDGYIRIGVWPTNNIGAFIHGNLKYHETWAKVTEGSWKSEGDQIVITNRLVRRIIEFAISEYQYDPRVKGKELNLRVLDDVIKWDDAVRAKEES